MLHLQPKVGFSMFGKTDDVRGGMISEFKT